MSVGRTDKLISLSPPPFYPKISVSKLFTFVRRRYTDHMKFYCFFRILFVLFCIIVYMVVCFVCFYLILYIMYSYCYDYVFLLLCTFRSRYCVSLRCSVYCLGVNVYCTAATGCQPNCS